MKIAAQVKLLPTPEQAEELSRTIKAVNAACDYVSNMAYGVGEYNKFGLQKLCYKEIRTIFGLKSQMACSVIFKTYYAISECKYKKIIFDTNGAIKFDSRSLSWKIKNKTVSISTLSGRIQVNFACGEKQLETLKTLKGESDLIYKNGNFILYQTCDVEEKPEIEPCGVLGVDMGIVNIAADSDGEVHSASHINNVRFRHRRLRAKLQAKGTRSAKRKLKKLSGKESRFAKDVNHCVSKKIVEKAKGTTRAIAIENLKGISRRVTVRRSQRTVLSSWSFFQLRTFIEYKARIAGVPVIAVDPRNTSRTCPECGYIDKANRKTQSKFECMSCGFSGLADHIAAVNISRRAVVNQPIVARVEAKAE